MGTALADVFDPAALDAEIEAQFVKRQTHPDLPLSIYTYSRTCQYSAHWTDVTRRCRGLVVDDGTGEVVAWCLPKFFNWSEYDQGREYAPPLPVEPFEVFTKVDGSLAIVFFYADRWRVASKGSFISEQARWAQRWLDQQDTSVLERGVTYLAEIVYPENRIVVDNGDRRELVYLASYDPDGLERLFDVDAQVWQALGGSATERHPMGDLADIVRMVTGNVRPDGTPATGTDAEGFVIRFASGVRAKCKFVEYQRLHKILTGITAREVWKFAGVETLAAAFDDKQLAQAFGVPVSEVAALRAIEGGPLSAMLEKVPDEFDIWVRGVRRDIAVEVDGLAAAVAAEFSGRSHLTGDRGAFAKSTAGLAKTVRSGLFLALDGRPIEPLLWRSVKPGPSDPFKSDEEG